MRRFGRVAAVLGGLALAGVAAAFSPVLIAVHLFIAWGEGYSLREAWEQLRFRRRKGGR